MDKEQKKMLVGTFLIHRVLIRQILLNSQENINKQFTKKAILNFKLIASLLYYLACSAILKDDDNYTDTTNSEVYLPIRISFIMKNDWKKRMKETYNIWVDKIISLL